MVNPLLNELLTKVTNIEAHCQDIPGPRIQETSRQFDSDSAEYELSEQVPTLAEFLELLEVVGQILELMGAKL